MQQTILALLALMIASLFSYNQDRSLLRLREAMVDTEMEVMASGVAIQVMEYIGRKAFDDKTTNGDVGPIQNKTFGRAGHSVEFNYGLAVREPGLSGGVKDNGVVDRR